MDKKTYKPDFNVYNYLIISSLLLIGCSFSFGQIPKVNPKLENALINLDFKAATEIAAASEARDFYLHHIYFLKAFLDPVPTNVSVFEHFSDSLLKNLTANHWYQAQYRLEKGLILLLQQEYFSAFTELQRSYSLAIHSKKKNDNIFVRRIIALFEIMAAIVPSKFHPFLYLFGFNPNLSNGVNELRQHAYQSYQPLTSEVQIVLFFVEKNFFNALDSAQARADFLIKNYPKSPISYYLKANSLFENRQNQAAINLLNSYLNLYVSPSIFPYLYYQLGKAYLQKADFINALNSYQQFLEFNAPLYKKDAGWKAGLCAHFLGMNNKARAYWEFAAQPQKKLFDEDQYAAQSANKSLLKTPAAINMQLFKARFLCDGGYFDRSLAVLDSIYTICYEETELRTEFSYRKARVYHEKKDTAAAIDWYKLVINEPAKENRWMTVYAMYYLGLLHEKKNPKVAYDYYSKVLSQSRNYNYQNALEQKVYARIKQLNY